MKIKVKDLEPNPYRKMERYPIDRAKVEMLKAKIKKTIFWDNILARNRNGKYEIAYGHHRLIALRELKIKEIDIPVKEISNSDMVLIMADENHNLMPSPAIMNETILAVKEYLDGELAKYETWEQAKKAQYLLTLFSPEKNPVATFGQAKGEQGIGEALLCRFLGPEWAVSIIRIGLRIIKTPANILDRRQVERMPSIRKAERFAQAVKKKLVPLKAQKRLADKVLKEDTSAEDISDLAAEYSTLPIKKEKAKPKSLPMLDDVIKETCGLMNTLYKQLNHIKNHIDNIQSKRLRETFIRDGRELMEYMKEIFENEKEEKKGILSKGS